MRRLFSTFATGAPGVGLLLMRAAVAAALLAHATTSVHGAASPGHMAAALVEGILGGLLLLGLWTPVAAVVAALEAAWIAFSGSGDLALWSFVGVMAIALALLGPGGWSIDARLFGWRRVDLRSGKGHGAPLD